MVGGVGNAGSCILVAQKVYDEQWGTLTPDDVTPVEKSRILLRKTYHATRKAKRSKLSDRESHFSNPNSFRQAFTPLPFRQDEHPASFSHTFPTTTTLQLTLIEIQPFKRNQQQQK